MPPLNPLVPGEEDADGSIEGRVGGGTLLTSLFRHFEKGRGYVINTEILGVFGRGTLPRYYY